jgi:subtilase family protein
MRARRRHGSSNTSRKIAGGVLAAAVAAGTAYAVPPATGAAPLSASAPAADADHHLSPRLTALLAAREEGLSAAATANLLAVAESGAGSLLTTPDGSRLVVDLRLDSRTPSVLAGLREAGATILSSDPSYGRVAISVRPQDLPAVGDVPAVRYVGEELTPQVNATCDATISEGVGILNADDLRTSAGVDGTGVKVGVISDSFDKATAPATTAAQDIVSDNLPGAANTCSHTTASTIGAQPSTGSDEGRAMMQIVHDVAPGASLDFESAFISQPSFAASITKLADQGASVIVDDVTYYDEPMYQDGVVEQAVTGVRARGVDYFSSSANNRYVKNGNEIGSYEAVGGYRPTACPAIPAITGGHVDCHNFSTPAAADNTFSYTNVASTGIQAVLNWAEPWDGGVNTDLDIYVINESTNAVITTVATPNAGVGGDQKAFEFYSVTQGASANRGIVIARKSSVAPAATPRFKFVFANGGGNPISTIAQPTPVPGTGDVMGPTAFGHNGGADVMSVGASDVNVPTALNSYSSYGPVTTLFGPVNGSTPAAPLASPRVVAKPDLVASDCNHTTFFSGASHVFCGTSAAAPHAAAVAALLRQKYPTATVASINSALVSTASPIAGVPGSFQGGGLVNALAAGSFLPPAPAVPGVSGADPASPGATTNPKVQGTAEAGATVSIYPTSDCSGPAAAIGTAAQFASPGIQVTVPVGGTRTFRATAVNPGGTSACSATSTTYTQQGAPVPPTVAGTDPVSPAASTTPRVVGIADAGATVSLYVTSDCSGPPVATGTAAQFASPGIQVTVAAGTTATVRAQASHAGGTSPCSATSTTYTQQVPVVPSPTPTPAPPAPPAPTPGTTLTATPKPTVRTSKSKVKVSFQFSSTVPGSIFTCSIDGKAFTPCTSGVSFKLKVGKHTFLVRATAGGVTDPTPASFAFKVKKKT